MPHPYLTARWVPAVLGLSLLATGCGQDPAAAADANEPAALTVLTAPAETTDIRASYTTTSHLVADREAPIVARVGGDVVDILVEEGDYVEKGQLLARLDGQRLRLELRRAETEVSKAAGELRRMTLLHQRNLVSTAALDDMQYRVNELRAGFELRRLEHGYTDIRSTIAGVVSMRAIQPGTHVNIGQTLFNVADTSRLVATLAIPQAELARFDVGNPVTVTTDAGPGASVHGSVARLSPTIDTATGTFRATVYLDNDAGTLAPGMLGRFDVAVALHRNAVVVPAGAVVREDQAAVVYTVHDGAAVRRRVRTGIEADGKVEILDGLSAGDSVVLEGQSRLRNGARVLARATPVTHRSAG